MRYLLASLAIAAFGAAIVVGNHAAVKQQSVRPVMTQADVDRILAEQVYVYDADAKQYVLHLGMTEAEVLAALGSFHCERSNRTVTRYGIREQWACAGKYGESYLYLDDGVLTAAQD